MSEYGANAQIQVRTRFFDNKSARNAFSELDTNVSFIIENNF